MRSDYDELLVLQVSDQKDANAEYGLLQPHGDPIYDTPRKMPRARINHDQERKREEEVELQNQEEEVHEKMEEVEGGGSEHVEDSPQPPQMTQPKVLESNPSFKTIVHDHGEFLEVKIKLGTLNKGLALENGNLGNEEMDVNHGATMTPTRKKSNNGSWVHSGPLTPEQVKLAALRIVAKADTLLESGHTSGRSGTRQDTKRAQLATTQTLTSPRAAPSQRARSPVPCRVPGNQQSGAVVEKKGTTEVDTLPRSPRYITPTIAASLKSVKVPSKTASSSRALSFGPTTSGHGTVDRDPVRTPHKDAQVRPTKEKKTYPSSLKVKTNKSTTTATSFKFRCDERAEKRMEYYSKLGDRLKAKEADKKQMEAKTQEAKESQLKELRRSLRYKANPVPSFYHEPPPPRTELRKTPPTRPKSPNFSPSRRRESISPRENDVSTPQRNRGRRSSLDNSLGHGRINQKVAKEQVEHSIRRLSSAKKPNLVQKGESRARSLSREKSTPSTPCKVIACPRTETSEQELLDDFEALTRSIEEEEANGRLEMLIDYGDERERDYGKEQGQDSEIDRGKVWSPEELARIYSKRQFSTQSTDFASVKDIVHEFSKRLGTPT